MKQQANIPYTIKHQCVALREAGKSPREIYHYYVSQMGNTQKFDSFRLTLRRWRKKIKLDPKFIKDTEILYGVNLGNRFDTKRATVQYNPDTQKIERIWARVEENEVSDTDRLIEAIKNTIPIQVKIEPIETEYKGRYEIPLLDQHFGNTPYEVYKPTQMKLLNKITSKTWKEIVVVMGQDMIHTDNFRGQTASGTMIGEIDLVKAWNDCLKFYSPIIEESLKKSEKVKVLYSLGNHDESISWAFVQMIKALYPQCEYDDSLEEYKVHMFGTNFVGFTHKPLKDIASIFAIMFPVEWSMATTREVHCGHFHHEIAKDKYGVVVRVLPTDNLTDKWHGKNGFVGTHKRFTVFEWSEEELESIHYV